MPMRPYGDTANDGMVQLSFTLPLPLNAHAQEAARRYAMLMGISNPLVAHAEAIDKAFTFFVIYGACSHTLDPATVQVDDPGARVQQTLDFHEINTLVVGRDPTPDQRRLYDLCIEAMAAGEKELRAARACRTVYEAVRDVFDRAGVAQHFPHHVGHGLGLTHPEAPYLVREADETLLAGDVVTLEPGLYIHGVGGIRIEHNYLITESGYERLSHHTIALK